VTVEPVTMQVVVGTDGTSDWRVRWASRTDRRVQALRLPPLVPADPDSWGTGDGVQDVAKAYAEHAMSRARRELAAARRAELQVRSPVVARIAAEATRAGLPWRRRLWLWLSGR
jgi:hypothetical protein